MGILDLPKTERQKYSDLKRVGPETVYEGLHQLLRIRIYGGNRRLATARDTMSAKHSSTGQGRTAPKAPMNFKNREELTTAAEAAEVCCGTLVRTG